MNDGVHGLPVPMVVYLSGPRRGAAVTLSGEEIRIGTGPEMDVRFPSGPKSSVARHHVTLSRRGASYELSAEPGHDVWVNGEPVERLVLASGDVLELGSGGAVLRFRLYPAGAAPERSVAAVFSDCVECAAQGSQSRLGRAAMLLGVLPYDMAMRTSLVFRGTILAALLALGASSWGLAHRSGALEDRLAEVTQQVELNRFLDRSREEARITETDLAELLGQVEAADARLDEMRAQIGAPARIIREASAATIFLQGAYGFRDPDTQRQVRLAVHPDGEPKYGLDGERLVTFEDGGPPLEIPYTGTGFVVSSDGLILTNRHVARPWDFDDAGKWFLTQGLEPVMRRFLGFLPGQSEPFALSFVAASDDADLALLRSSSVTHTVPHLELADLLPQPGDEVIVLGYPLGIRALIARADPAFLRELSEGGGADSWSVARRLSERGFVAPLATRGIVGQRTEQFVVYDAETTSGGSGGPVLDMNGRVVAVNAAIMPEFGGSNLGVPVLRARELLGRVRSAP